MFWYFQQVKHIGATIYSSSRDKTIKAWQAHEEGNEPLLTFEGHRLVVTAIDPNEGNQKLILLFICVEVCTSGYNSLDVQCYNVLVSWGILR